MCVINYSCRSQADFFLPNLNDLQTVFRQLLHSLNAIIISQCLHTFISSGDRQLCQTFLGALCGELKLHFLTSYNRYIPDYLLGGWVIKRQFYSRLTTLYTG